jgi:hypothetical protein
MTTPDVHWYIQEARLPEWENIQRAVYIIQEMGMTAHVRPYVPFGGMDWSFLPEDRPVVALGSLAVALDHQRRAQPHRPFVWFDQERLRCSHYFPRYRDALISRDHAFVTYAELLAGWGQLFETLGKDGRLFIKPDANDKAFDGVVKADMLEAWKVMAESRGEPAADLPCVAARGDPRRVASLRGRREGGGRQQVSGERNSLQRGGLSVGGCGAGRTSGRALGAAAGGVLRHRADGGRLRADRDRQPQLRGLLPERSAAHHRRDGLDGRRRMAVKAVTSPAVA